MGSVERLPRLTVLQRQRGEIVGRIIRYGGGFGYSKKRCYDCVSRLTARVRPRVWSCPWHWPVVQLELCA